MTFHKNIVKLFAALVLVSSSRGFAQEYVSVSSTTDGHGLFSYTFDLGNPAYVWEIQPINGAIGIQSHGILEVSSPTGWVATVDANEFITWHPTNGTFYLGQPPITFSVLSSNTNSTLYDQWTIAGQVYSKGVIVGTLFTAPDHQIVGESYETFSFLGPQVKPACRLDIQRAGDTMVLSWTNTAFILESAASPSGNYTNVDGAVSPFTNNASGSTAFFRLKSN